MVNNLFNFAKFAMFAFATLATSVEIFREQLLRRVINPTVHISQILANEKQVEPKVT